MDKNSVEYKANYEGYTQWEAWDIDYPNVLHYFSCMTGGEMTDQQYKQKRAYLKKTNLHKFMELGVARDLYQHSIKVAQEA